MSSVRGRPRVLIVDDEAPIRRFLRIALASEDYDVLEAASGKDGLSQVERCAPDLIVLDLGLPGLDGQAVLREIRSRGNHAPVIILSVRADQKEKVEALDAGANDYVTKPFGLPEFLARVRGVFRRPDGDHRPNTSFRDDRLIVDLHARSVHVDGRAVHLTRKEFSVLQELVRYAGRVVTHRHLLQEIWGATHVNQAHYLRIIVGRLRQKIGDSPIDPAYIVTEPGVGYRFGGQDSDRRTGGAPTV